MITVAVTGSNGFIRKNLLEGLSQGSTVELSQPLDGVDLNYHLAGANRPDDLGEFKSGNVKLTQAMVNTLVHLQ